MRSKTLTGTYSSGYILHSQYSTLKLTESAYVGGKGVQASAPAKIENGGTIEAGHVYDKYASGKTGIELLAGGSVANFGIIVGGNGSARPRAGGDGGNGVYLASGAVTNRGTIIGGSAEGTAGFIGPRGAYGVEINSVGTVTNNGLIVGGVGADGVTFRGNGFGGGPGGAAIDLVAGGELTNTGGTIVGGAGGIGGAGYHYTGPGGMGGAGLSASGAVNLTNKAILEGGKGGTGGFYYYDPRDRHHSFRAGGLGGAGAAVVGGTVLNSGTLVGGGGGTGGGGQGVGQLGGAGGAGLASTSTISLRNKGVLLGGSGGDGGQVSRPPGNYSVTGMGGQGGYGVQAAGGDIVNHGMIDGGVGGNGGGETGAYLAIGGAGGAGGAAAIFSKIGTLTNYGSRVTGGAGGAGASDPTPGSYGGRGGTGGAGVILDAAGTVSNLASVNTGAPGVIAGGKGGTGGHGSAYYAAGGGGGAAVDLIAGGIVVNPCTIVGGAGGAGGGRGAPSGVMGDGVVLSAGGTVINGGASSPSALVEGAVGVSVAGPGAATVTNYGTIDGTTGVAVQFGGTSDMLIAEAGSVFLGAADGAGGVLALAGGTGTITGLGSGGTVSGAISLAFESFGFYRIEVGGVWTVTGTTSLAASQSLFDFATLVLDGPVTNAGTIRAGAAGDLVIASALDNSGAMIANGVLSVEGAVSGAGMAEINGGTVNFLSTFNEAVIFLGSGTLDLSDSQDYTAQISGFPATGGGHLDLGDIGFVGVDEATFSGTETSGVLTVTDGVHAANINLTGDFLSTTFVAASDGHGGTLIDAQPTDAAPSARSLVAKFTAAMSAMAEPPGQSSHSAEAWVSTALSLSRPLAAMA